MVYLEVGDIVMCTVEKVEKTIVFVKIDGNGEGSIIMSEIAPGRIRNIRDYVVPKKRIICKVLRVSGNRIELSLRRVTLKEQKEIKEKAKEEKSFRSIIKSVAGEKVEGIIKEIEKNYSVHDFIQEIKEDVKKLEKLVGKDAKKVIEILNTQKKKKAAIKREFTLTTTAPNGLELIKQTLTEQKEIKIKYLGAGKYSIETESENLKETDSKIRKIVEELEQEAKKHKMNFSIKEK